jgi:hypothetical protein
MQFLSIPLSLPLSFSCITRETNSVQGFPFSGFRNRVLYTFGRTSWVEGRPLTWPLSTQDNTNAEETQEYIHGPSGIRTQDSLSEWHKTIHTLNRAAIVIGFLSHRSKYSRCPVLVAYLTTLSVSRLYSIGW